MILWYKTEKMNNEFKSLKKEILVNDESNKKIEELIYLNIERESIITKKLLDLEPKTYFLFYLIFSTITIN